MGLNKCAVFVLVLLGLWWLPVFAVARTVGVRCVWVCTCCSCMLALLTGNESRIARTYAFVSWSAGTLRRFVSPSWPDCRCQRNRYVRCTTPLDGATVHADFQV